MKKTRLIIVPINQLKGHAALTLIRKFGNGESRKIPVDYKKSKTELPANLEEESVLVLGFNGPLAKLALKEGISLPRAVARFITKNEDNATTARFLKKVEKVLASSAETQNFRKGVNNWLKTFEPAVAVRMVTGAVERMFSLSGREINASHYIVKTFGTLRVAEVKKENIDPFTSQLILEKGVADIVVQRTIDGTQISRKPAAASVVSEIANQIKREGIALGDGNSVAETGNTLSFTTTKVMEGKTFPTHEHVCVKLEEVCVRWSNVTVKDFATTTVE
jgi:hypothetical protein